MHTAISMRFSECASLLIGAYRQSGLPLPIDSMGRTLLHVAACAGTDGQDILSGEKYSEEVRAFIAEVACLEPLDQGTVDPDLAVALGAALYGGMLDGVVKDGVDVVDGMYTW